jgi:hypothetical protein
MEVLVLDGVAERIGPENMHGTLFEASRGMVSTDKYDGRKGQATRSTA